MHRVFELVDGHIHNPSLDDMDFHRIKWVEVSRPSELELKRVSELTGFSLYEVRSFIDRDELPRILESTHFSGLIFRVPVKRGKVFSTASITFLVSENLVVTLHNSSADVLNDFKHFKDEELASLLERGSAWFVYEFLERVIAKFFVVLDDVEEQIDTIEDSVFTRPEQKTVRKIFLMKRTLIYFQKGLSANRDMLVSLQKDGANQFSAELVKKFSHLYYDVIQLTEVVAIYRDILTGALDIYLSAVSNNMNSVMKKMAAYGTLVLVPTFITGLYGMNFRFMPEISWAYGYGFAWFLILGSVFGLSWYFKKNDWF